MASIQSLPDELLERVLIACAENDAVDDVAAVAATSRRFYSIVYLASDDHLWRSLFLILFDDPRDIRSRLVPEIAWKSDLQDRVRIRRLMTRRTADTMLARRTIGLRSRTVMAQTVDHPLCADVSIQLLRGVIKVIHTAAPQLSLTCQPSGASGQAALPPIRNEALRELHLRTSLWPAAPDPTFPSANIAWLGKTLPSDLHATLSVLFEPKNADDSLDSTSTHLVIGQVISYLGTRRYLSAHTTSTATPHTINQTVQATQSGNIVAGNDEDSPSLKDAMQRAFDLDYPSHRQGWGPYLPARLSRSTAQSSTGETPYYDSDSDFDDPDWNPDDVNGPRAPIPPPERLLPDWWWLCAARAIAEWALREHNSLEDIQTLQAWDNLREGAWISQPPESSASEVASDSAPGDSNWATRMHEYDWAGVEGMWRRLVAWLDYDDLLFHNRVGDFDDPVLEPVWIIVPLSLRITGYSPSHVIEYPDKPTIHVSGEMGGAGWQGDADENDIRHVHGTVSMLADGSVRWSITSMNEDNTHDQWASEAVQLGGVGSAMGSLGMWTGAEHESEDPLGVIWQWRVG